MRLLPLSIISGAVLLGIALGLILAPSLRQTGPADSRPSQGKSATAATTSVTTDAPANSPSRTRARDREPAKKTDEPRISVPVKAMVAILQGSLGSPRFSELEKKVGPALESLGASMTEKDEIEDLIRKSKDEVTAAEKTHFKLGLVTPDRIEIDTSGMREPISAIIGRLKDGIHATLRPEAAEILISAINWKSYYWIDEKDLVTTLEIIRKPSGELSASSRDSISSSGRAIDRNFPDDGTPLPADQVYPEHWRPLLKGLTLIPKDER